MVPQGVCRHGNGRQPGVGIHPCYVKFKVELAANLPFFLIFTSSTEASDTCDSAPLEGECSSHLFVLCINKDRQDVTFIPPYFTPTRVRGPVHVREPGGRRPDVRGGRRGHRDRARGRVVAWLHRGPDGGVPLQLRTTRRTRGESNRLDQLKT